MSSYHPLRPIGRVLVCEGKDDVSFINGVLGSSIQNLNIYAANGKSNVKTLAHILSPVTSIVDRDFDVLPNEIQDNWNTQDHNLHWIRHDIEAYLLYPDWLLQFAQRYRENINPRSRFLPVSETEVEEGIIEVSNNLVADHAGRHTISWIKKIVNHHEYRLEFNLDKKSIQSGASFSLDAEWRIELQKYHEILRNAPQRFIPLTQVDVLKYYEEMLLVYSDATKTSIQIQQYFSGKRILEHFTQKWHIESRNNKKPVDVLRDALIELAINYAKQITRLSDDPRLGDFGRLASKIISRDI
ncbi:MAG: DUF4435 domain-containing protein [Anaerolineae bacterium]|nr:DUF4435 domain-containing protein [Anaerolineae bacterium]